MGMQLAFPSCLVKFAIILLLLRSAILFQNTPKNYIVTNSKSTLHALKADFLSSQDVHLSSTAMSRVMSVIKPITVIYIF